MRPYCFCYFEAPAFLECFLPCLSSFLIYPPDIKYTLKTTKHNPCQDVFSDFRGPSYETDKMIKFLYLEVSRSRKDCEYFFPNHQHVSDSVLGYSTVLRLSLPSLSSKLHLSSVLAVCPSPVAQAWLVFVLWAPFQLTLPPALRHHLPTNMVTEKVISPPHSDGGWCFLSLGHLVT